MEHLTEYLKVFIAVFVLVNPLEGIPIYLARSQGMTPSQQLSVARTCSFAIVVVLWTTLLIGHVLLQLLGISVGAFTIAGGIIIFLIALNMVLGPNTPPQKSSSLPDETNFAVVPLAIPLLAGPGAISSVILYASKGITGKGPSMQDNLVLAGIILFVAAAAFVSLAVASPTRRILGDNGINVFTRISGILVAAIAISLINEGFGMLYPQIIPPSH